MKKLFLSLLVCMVTMACTAVSCWAGESSGVKPEVAPFIGRWQVIKSEPVSDVVYGKVHEIGVGTVIDIQPNSELFDPYELKGIVVTPSSTSEFAVGDEFLEIGYASEGYESDLFHNKGAVKDYRKFAWVGHKEDGFYEDLCASTWGYVYIDGDVLCITENKDVPAKYKHIPIKEKNLFVRWMLKRI
ncbi:hypothetical protein [Selenomonas sp. AE3005]|uniref:hypothetical protein n=1 Tax=Selenomonas sp. AE3005 TaxID=1485543 RepID=UPI0025F06A38|nr:hypothetical protein [Selenomonas sp. AE3005]